MKGEYLIQRLLFLVLGCAVIDSAFSEVFHIVESHDTRCPWEIAGDPCVTLQQYATNPSQASNITLEIQAGFHNLDTGISFTNVEYVIIRAAINTTINCSSSSVGISITSATKVNISGLLVHGCGSIVINTITDVHISNASFIESGGVSMNTVNTTVVENVVLQSLYVHSSGITFRNSDKVQISNVSYFSSGVSFNNVKQGSIWGTMFLVTVNGYFIQSESSSISVKECTFHVNNRYRRPRGAINGYASNITVHHSRFNGITNAISVQHDRYFYYRRSTAPTLLISNSLFANATRNYYNGPVIKSINVNTTITDCSFENNTMVTGSGAAIHVVARNNYISLLRNTFWLNSARSNGGALSIISNGGFITLKSNIFRENTANKGGAIFINATGQGETFVSIYRNEFTNNVATIAGGAIYYATAAINTSATLLIVESTFHGNSAAYCGALDAEKHNDNITIANSIFTSNRATAQLIGGGVACVRNASLSVSNSIFKNNVAELHAGVFYADESLVTVVNSLFMNNSAAEDGGVMYTYVYPTRYIIQRSIFYKNSAGSDGGALFIGKRTSRATISSSLFDSNSASVRGGAVAIVGSKLTIRGTNIFNNTAELGGVISACSSNVNISNDDGLIVTDDPHYPSICSLYDGDVDRYNIKVDLNQLNETTIIRTVNTTTTTGMPTTPTSRVTTSNMIGHTTPNSNQVTDYSSSGQFHTDSTPSNGIYSTSNPTHIAESTTKSNTKHSSSTMRPQEYTNVYYVPQSKSVSDGIHWFVTAALVVIVASLLTMKLYSYIKAIHLQKKTPSYKHLDKDPEHVESELAFNQQDD